MGKLFILFPNRNYKRGNVNKEWKEILCVSLRDDETKHLHLKAFFAFLGIKFQFSVVTNLTADNSPFHAVKILSCALIFRARILNGCSLLQGFKSERLMEVNGNSFEMIKLILNLRFKLKFFLIRKKNWWHV